MKMNKKWDIQQENLKKLDDIVDILDRALNDLVATPIDDKDYETISNIFDKYLNKHRKEENNISDTRKDI